MSSLNLRLREACEPDQAGLATSAAVSVVAVLEHSHEQAVGICVPR